MHLLMMAARLELAVVCLCVFGLMTVLVSSVVMSGTPGPRHARGSLVIFLDWAPLHRLGVVGCAMLGFPLGCTVCLTGVSLVSSILHLL